MNRIFSLIIITLCLVACTTVGQTYVGSTPAHQVVRSFLQISLTDSIDFIRWKLELSQGKFKIHCRYGLAKAGTPGFSNEKTVRFEGSLTKNDNYYYLTYKDRKICLLGVNENIFHFLDNSKKMLIGNGGYSYALNCTTPVTTNGFTIKTVQAAIKSPMVFEGRTPCQQLSSLLNLHKGNDCEKMKWYIQFYTDAVTGNPSYYLKGGASMKKEEMERGSWQIISKPDGRIVYQIKPENGTYTLNLLKGDDNILFFTDSNGNVFVGNEDFSYTLNRRIK